MGVDVVEVHPPARIARFVIKKDPQVIDRAETDTFTRWLGRGSVVIEIASVEPLVLWFEFRPTCNNLSIGEVLSDLPS